MHKILVLSILIFFLFGHAHANSLKDIDGVKHSAKVAMQKVEKGKISELFDSLKPIWPIPEAEINVAKDQTITTRKMVDDRFGKSVGIQHVSTETIADTIIKIVYLEKFQRHAIRWTFFYYKPDNEWFLNTFEWDDKMRLLFK